MHIAHGILMLLMHQTWPKLSRLVSKFLRLPQLPEGNWSTAIRSYARASGCGQVVLLSSSHFEGLASTNDSSSITILPNLRLQRKPSTHLQSMQISVTLVTFLQTSCQLPSKALPVTRPSNLLQEPLWWASLICKAWLLICSTGKTPQQIASQIQAVLGKFMLHRAYVNICCHLVACVESVKPNHCWAETEAW